MILSLSKNVSEGSGSKTIKLVAKPLLLPFFEKFEETGKDFTNIFNLSL